jgi:hypothetical protein
VVDVTWNDGMIPWLDHAWQSLTGTFSALAAFLPVILAMDRDLESKFAASDPAQGAGSSERQA